MALIRPLAWEPPYAEDVALKRQKKKKKKKNPNPRMYVFVCMCMYTHTHTHIHRHIYTYAKELMYIYDSLCYTAEIGTTL